MKQWNLDSAVYHIYVRSFKDTNDDGIGDLQGIVEKLDYIQSLGVDAIWLSPINNSPNIDYGYDVSNYCTIEPSLGNMQDFERLIEEAHKRDIKVMMDYVPNHTSSEHDWFLESRSSRDNPKRDWYIWKDPKSDGSPSNNWLSVFGGSAWEWDEKTKQHYLHTFAVHQPDLNWRNPEVVKEMLDVLRFWLNKGVDGFRFDAIYFLFKDERFLDEPANPAYVFGTHEPYDTLLHPYTLGLPEVLQMLKRMSQTLAEYQNKFMVTEAYVSTQELGKMYEACETHLYAPFNFSLITLPWKAPFHRQFLEEYSSVVGDKYFETHVIGNHDKPRVVTRIGEAQARVAAMFLLTLRGIPFIYFGDELGMKDGMIPREKVQDVWEKNMPGLKLGRDPQRIPMQWNDGEYAGFSHQEPWLPVADNYKEINVETEEKNPHSSLNLYKKLIFLRKIHPPLCSGKYQHLDMNHEEVMIYTRSNNNEKALVILNFSDNEQTVELPFKHLKMLCNTYLDREEGVVVGGKDFKVRPHEGCLLLVQ